MRTFRLLLYFVIVFCFAGCINADAQDEEESTSQNYATEYDNTDLIKSYYTKYDSASVEVRRFSPAELTQLRQDPELSYGYTRAAMTLWDAFWRWVGYQLRDMFSTATPGGDWDEILLFILFAAVLVYAIIRLLKFAGLRAFYGEKDKKPVDPLVIHENIHEMDFEKLLQEATENRNYRLAVRLFYLWGLKMLTDNHHLHWEPGKTNHDYLRELSASGLKGGFHQLSYYFEYAWYGDFPVTPELFSRVNGIFTEWKTRI